MLTLRHVLIIGFLIIAHSANAAKPPVYSGGKLRAAIKGYDPVAYFVEGKPVEGSPEFAFTYNGATWLFYNEINRQAFQNEPEKFSPQYGGYCAYAVSQDKTASIKPEYFTLHDGKLYLNYSKSVYKKWLKNKEQYIDDANEHWPNLVTHPNGK